MSIAINIAEGKGHFSIKEFVKFLYISRGSLYETMTLLEIFRRKGWISEEKYLQSEKKGLEIAFTLKGLINSIAKQN
jgi:four helix bundle protein